MSLSLAERSFPTSLQGPALPPQLEGLFHRGIDSLRGTTQGDEKNETPSGGIGRTLSRIRQFAAGKSQEALASYQKAALTRETLTLIEAAVANDRISLDHPERHPKVVLITDFGDGIAQTECSNQLRRYGVPGSAISDQINTVEAFNITNAAFHVHQVCKTLTPGDVIELVVDPGVGNDVEEGGQNDRRIVAKSKDGIWLIGPNNGCFDLVEIAEAWEIDFDKLKDLGVYDGNTKAGHSTFHGRDVFAPVAAVTSHISRNSKSPEVQKYVLEATVAKPLALEELHHLDIRDGQVIHTDAYGNLKVNLDFESTGLETGTEVDVAIIRDEQNRLILRVVNGDDTVNQELSTSPGARIKAKVVNSFAESNRGDFVLYRGSSKRPRTQNPALELAVNESSARAEIERLLAA